ncbi:MAG: GldG family protein [Deltaproteobacteria bacterium]|nr:GldG family protein [Deltaproteobacteria bacterium]
MAATESKATTAKNQRGRLAGESLLFLSLLIAIAVVLNVIGYHFDMGKVDLTEAGLWSLSDGSKRVAASLDDRMEITAYYTDNLPAPFNTVEESVRDLLAEYAAASGGKIHVRIVHPSTDEERQAAEDAGVPAQPYQGIVDDVPTAVQGYSGIVMTYLGKKQTLPNVRSTAGLEYTLTQKIRELIGDKITIGVLTGHDGPTLTEGLTGLKSALPTYNIQEVDAHQEISHDLKALLIIGPETEISEIELRHIDQYVMGGGSLGVFGGGIKLSLQGQPSAEAVQTGLNALLTHWGVRMHDDLVADAQCSRAPMRGPFGLQVAVPYPPVPVVNFDEAARAHPALFRLNTEAFPFTSSLELTTAPPEASVRVLARSSDNSWLMTGAHMDIQPKRPEEWHFEGASGPFPLMVAIQGTLPSAYAAASVSTPDGGVPSNGGVETPATSTAPARVMVVGTSAMLRDEFLPQSGPNGERDTSRMAMALNIVDWLAQDDALIAIRAKNVEDPGLDVPSAVKNAFAQAQQAAQAGDREGVQAALGQRSAELDKWRHKKAMYRWFNTLGIPFAFGIFGFIRWRMRQARKQSAQA